MLKYYPEVTGTTGTSGFYVFLFLYLQNLGVNDTGITHPGKKDKRNKDWICINNNILEKIWDFVCRNHCNVAGKYWDSYLQQSLELTFGFDLILLIVLKLAQKVQLQPRLEKQKMHHKFALLYRSNHPP